ncbi:MAG: alpha-xylosidase [Clostridiales bacterium]|nr:alpha-xylosidase [Clostridiales bacterium]
MKFTEGYWLSSEKAHPCYAMEAYEVEKIPGGMRILAPTRKIENRGMTLNLPTITLEFTAHTQDTISVEAWHYEAYENHAPSFEKTEAIYEEVTVDITEEEALMDTGKVQVRVKRKEFAYTVEADGKVLTGSGFHNLGYMRWNRKTATMFPEENYLTENYQPYMVSELSLQPGECVYGLGERFTAFVKNGQVVNTWNEDGGTSSQVAYKSIPFYMTNCGYGVLVDSSDRVSFEVASEKVEYVGFSVPGERIRFYIFHGPTPKEIMREYTGLTGKPALPPAWSFGLWLSTSFTTNYDEETTTSFIDGMNERDIPLHVFHFDCFWMQEFHWCDFTWDKRFFPDIRSTLKKYHEKGLKICVWINPYIAQGTEFFREGVKNGYLLKRADQRGVWQTDNWQAGMGLVDFTNPDAVVWYTDKLKTVLDCGVDCFKTDFGERIPVDVTYFDGSDPYAMHNYYTYLYNKAVFELLETYKGENEAVLFARSATVGGQKFPVHWGGDCSANYPSMAETLRGGLSFAMSGFSFWSHDISGFESTAEPDLYKRWTAFGLLSTHSRLHGSGSYRVPWLFDEEACRVTKFFTNLKCRLMPYIYQKAVEAHEEGTPVMRPMVFEYPTDPAAKYLDQQYMLGDALMVAPVFREDHEAEYYLPNGIWTDLLTGEAKEGGRWYRGSYDYFSLPLYVRPNTILVLGNNEEKPDYDYSDRAAVRIYQLDEGKTVSAKIPDIHGKTVNTIYASNENGVIRVWTEKAHTPMKIEVFRGQEKRETVLTDKEGTIEISYV